MDDKTQDKLAEAKKQYEKAESAWSEIYEKQEDDLYFLSDNEDAQWNTQDLNSRKLKGRPSLTIDQLSQFVHQVVNDIRMNTPTINIIPKGDSDIKTAEIYKGLIRHIQQSSEADGVYDNAVEFSIKSSIGFIRVDHDYEDNMSFDQKLIIEPIVNPQGVLIDPESIKLDGSDSNFAFVLEEMYLDDFKEEYPDEDAISFNADKESKQGETVVIAEYFYKDTKKIKVGQRTNELGETITEEVQKDVEYDVVRDTTEPTIYRCKMSGANVLEETTFPGDYIPIVPVYGEVAYEKGVRNLKSLIRKSKDAQRYYNYWRSLEAELLMSQPRAPVMAAVGQTEEFAQDWTNPDKAAVLRYKPTDVNGNPVPAPQRLAPPQMPTGILGAARECVDDIKATMGMYGASVGQRTNETSGIAIQARKLEGDVATFHFGDNLVKSITQVGRILVSAIPEIYDTKRIITIIGDEEDTSTIGINGAMAEEQEEEYDFTNAKYDVKVTTGAPFTTQREETATLMMDILNKNPQMLNIIGDLAFKNSDMAGAQAIAKRLEKVIDPKLLQDDDNVTQEQMIIQQLQGQLQQMGEALESKQAEDELKRQVELGKLAIDKAKIDLDTQKLELDQMKAVGDYSIKDKNNKINAFKAETDAEYKDVDSELKVMDGVKGIVELQQSQSNDADVY